MLNTKPGLVAGYLARHLTVHHVICQTVRWRKNAFFRPSGNFSLVSTSGHDCPALLAQHASFKCLLLGKLVFFLNQTIDDFHFFSVSPSLYHSAHLHPQFRKIATVSYFRLVSVSSIIFDISPGNFFDIFHLVSSLIMFL